MMRLGRLVMLTAVARRGGLLFVVAMMVAMLGCGDDPCTDVVAVGGYDKWAALIKRDGSVWTWVQGVGPKEPVTIAVEHSGASGFSNAGMCLTLATGDVTCPVLSFLENARQMLDAQVQEVSHWAGSFAASPAMCAVLWDGTLSCNVTVPSGFAPVAAGIRHVSIGPSLCAITDQGKLSIPWQGFSTADWSLAAASLTDVVEVVTLSSVSQPGCVARTAGGQIWWIHEDRRQDPPVVSDEVVGIGGPVTQMVTGIDIDGDFVCALVLDGTVSCWTAGGSGGSVVPKDSTAPTVARKIPGLPGVATGLAGGLGYTCASLQDGTVWCWGIGNSGARIRC